MWIQFFIVNFAPSWIEKHNSFEGVPAHISLAGRFIGVF